jgi:hypothetical protein
MALVAVGLLSYVGHETCDTSCASPLTAALVIGVPAVIGLVWAWFTWPSEE